ncbi:hypothetical protein BS50DRAFT_336804 [Corynespora cassiicola Philippines]|uniref:Hypersensitive response inducing protein 1 n=1 Tax=Corynespora cassiicola Philippines TaxID=1448308 RepID=A0A2T2NV36_CORCC|nr:hypothetical protein BS50DRAFT_336804 [Corynespora cassiicola Philippines]
MPSLTSFLSTLVLPTLLLASPTPLVPRQDDACAPTSYTITNYSYTAVSGKDAHLSFDFQPNFSDPSIISDPVGASTSCTIDAPSGTIPNSNECSSPGRSLLLDLRAPQEQAYYQITHTWGCNGQEWMSGTAVKIQPLQCEQSAEAGSMLCASEAQTFAPQNVRKICWTPNCVQ